MLNIIIFLIMSLIYNGYIISKYGIPVSLSETSYLLGGNRRYFFTLYCYITAFLIIPVLISTVPETLVFLPFLMCSGLLFAGASPLFKTGTSKPVHYIFSLISFICYIFFMIFVMGWQWLLAFGILFISLCIWKKECFVYFAEILTFLFISIFIILP